MTNKNTWKRIDNNLIIDYIILFILLSFSKIIIVFYNILIYSSEKFKIWLGDRHENMDNIVKQINFVHKI